MSYMLDSNPLSRLAYQMCISACLACIGNFLAKITVSSLNPKPRIENDTETMRNPVNFHFHFGGTFEDLCSTWMNSAQAINYHLNSNDISIIEITQQSALKRLSQSNKPKTILGLSAQQYVEGGYEELKGKLKILLEVEELTEQLLKNLKIVFTGFSQGGGVCIQVAEKLLTEFNLDGGNISVLSINGAVHGTVFGSLLPSWMSDLGAFLLLTCIKDFKEGSEFFQKNKLAIAKLNNSIHFTHAFPDLLISPTNAGATKFNFHSEKTSLAIIALSIFLSLCNKTETDGAEKNGGEIISLIFCAASATLALALSNHILSPKAREVGVKLREIAN